MTKQRPHWDDDLFEAVSLHIDDGYGDIHAVIATVEDWCVKAHLRGVYVKRMNDAEAAIQRVRAAVFGPTPAVHGGWMAGYASAMRDVLRALDGERGE